MIRKSKGFSLIEVAVVLIGLGIISVLVWHGYRDRMIAQSQLQARSLLDRADNAVTSFAAANFRLPCPDTDNDGRENCGASSQIGTLPYQTIGMADIDAGRLRYGAMIRSDGNVQVAADRYFPLLAQLTSGNPVASNVALNNVNGADFCSLTRTMAKKTLETTALHTIDSDANKVQVAYAIAASGLIDKDGTGGLFDGNNTGSVTFAAPSSPISDTYDDHVVAVGFDQLWTRLGCSEVMASAEHGHFNVASAATIYEQNMIDYKKILELQRDLAKANVKASTAAVESSAAGVTSAITGGLSAAAEVALSNGTNPLSYSALAVTIASGVTAALSTISAGISLGLANSSLTEAENRVTEVAAFVSSSAALALLINTHAKSADSYGIY